MWSFVAVAAALASASGALAIHQRRRCSHIASSVGSAAGFAASTASLCARVITAHVHLNPSIDMQNAATSREGSCPACSEMTLRNACST